MPSRHKYRSARNLAFILAVMAGLFRVANVAPANDGAPASAVIQSHSLRAGESARLALGWVETGKTYRLLVSIVGAPLAPNDRIRVELAGPGSDRLTKELNAGDPDLYVPYRNSHAGNASLALNRSADDESPPVTVRVDWARLDLAGSDRAAIEAEPNDTWQQANDLVLGRDVYGSADDVDYLDNKDEGKSGLDWFRFEVKENRPLLVYFQLDLLDRDVSANLRVYTIDPRAGRPEPYLKGKDPMEIVHDRERERYSKHISRTFTRGTYYLEVNANHPDYILRTRVLPVPPYDDPAQAIEAGMQYIINVGDAWFAQIPREGNIYVRADNLHDTATRCTACHSSSFSTEANLASHRNGYPIRSKSNFQYVIDRLYNSPTPLYGDDRLYWQRFIAIPLQAQGKHGGILLDFEKQVSQEPTKTVERFAPFLRKAWDSRRDLPADEVNGVIPLDSKFGLAWRDWRLLDELAHRTGRDDFAKAAARIASILVERSADRRIESLQDRIHRLYAWWLIDPTKFANKIKRETGALLRFQNPDGGWHEVDTGPGPSAVYTTGQLTWTLLRIGLPRDHPAVARALRYLLSQQQDFGGWIQTTTHENFRTPMRETRYAVMALAEAFPRPEAPLVGWGNRDEGPARLPRTDNLIHTLDDLENLWDVPGRDRARFAAAIEPLLEHREPTVRAAAAACLGRLGQPISVAPVASRLNDPSKIVWRSAAWALRRLGNRGIGHEAIIAALASRDPATRRGAARIFAYQFYGMDDRPELTRPFLDLTLDADLLTRLQALRTLRQWFYRTADAAMCRRIVETYLTRMSHPDAPVVRKSLSEGLYIMMDENLGGGVSLQKNIGELPEGTRPGILEARKEFERHVLLAPVLTALRSGNELERAGVLKSFDGSFFKGRAYARQPEGMIDVGNDREFGFLWKPSLDELETAFVPLLQAELPAESRRQAIQLSSFFRIPGETRNTAIQIAILKRLSDPDEAVRAIARTVVAAEVDLAGAEADPARLELIIEAVRAPAPEREAILRAIGRNERLTRRPELMRVVHGLVNQLDAAPSLIPLLRWSTLRDAEVLAIVLHSWPRLSPAQRLAAIEAVLARPALAGISDPREPVMQVLRRGVTDPSPEVRERTLVGVSQNVPLWAGERAAGLVLTSLADDTPSMRRLGIKLASSRVGFWYDPEPLEYLKQLLIDPDAGVRSAAIDAVRDFDGIRGNQVLAGLSRRIKVLEADPEPSVESRARSLLTSRGFDPAAIQPDARLRRPRLLSLSTFRDQVNPLFYLAGEDGHSCAECHGNHTILRIAPADATSGEDVLIVNYNSALKVVSLGEPESSLILRKPMSPRGQGVADPSSPTGLTHVGGPRWESTEHPAYRAILKWIRQASEAAASSDASTRLSADSYSPGYEPERAGDGDPATIWHTEFVGGTPGYPHELIVDLGSERRAEGLLYVPRQDSSNGRVRDYEVRLSKDGRTWSVPVAGGRWENDPTYKSVALPSSPARFVQLRGLSEVEGRPVMSAAEVVVESRPAHPPSTR
jgi:HEAT repeat protein